MTPAASPRPHASAVADARRRQATGLLLIAAIILLVILLRAPAHLLFPSGWWRP